MGAATTQVGIDIGGTATRFVAVDSGGTVLGKLVVRTPGAIDGRDVQHFLLDGIEQVARGCHPASIGIGASGPIDLHGVIRNPDTLPAFTDVEIVEPIMQRYGVLCKLDNDAVTAAFGENQIGASRGFRSALMITLGTGVGVSMIQDGMPVRGADGVHPESGHMCVGNRFGPAPCYCGKSICWEQIASRTSLQARAEALHNTALSGTEAIGLAYKAALSGDAQARKLFVQYGSAIAEGLANLMTIYRPPCVVIGGAGAQYIDLFGESLRSELASHLGVFPEFKLVQSELGDFGGAIGAALLAREPLYGA